MQSAYIFKYYGSVSSEFSNSQKFEPRNKFISSFIKYSNVLSPAVGNWFLSTSWFPSTKYAMPLFISSFLSDHTSPYLSSFLFLWSQPYSLPPPFLHSCWRLYFMLDLNEPQCYNISIHLNPDSSPEILIPMSISLPSISILGGHADTEAMLNVEEITLLSVPQMTHWSPKHLVHFEPSYFALFTFPLSQFHHHPTVNIHTYTLTHMHHTTIDTYTLHNCTYIIQL